MLTPCSPQLHAKVGGGECAPEAGAETAEIEEGGEKSEAEHTFDEETMPCVTPRVCSVGPGAGTGVNV